MGINSTIKTPRYTHDCSPLMFMAKYHRRGRTGSAYKLNKGTYAAVVLVSRAPDVAEAEGDSGQ